MIHIITPTTRPENLPEIYAAIMEAITATKEPFRWHVVFDGEPKELNYPLSSFRFTEFAWQPSAGKGAWGNPQRNRGLEEVARFQRQWEATQGNDACPHCERSAETPLRYVYFCDDDNIPHPGLFERAMALQGQSGKRKAESGNGNGASDDGGRIVIVNQIRKDGSVRLRVNNDVVLCGIDTAQAFIPHALIGDLRWDAFPNPADYYFLRALWEKHRERFIFLNENLSHYNYLRVNGPP